MPTRLKNLKEKAQTIAKGLNHDMGKFERCSGAAWVSFCHGCGRQMMVDPEVDLGYWGDALGENCGPVQPEVPIKCNHDEHAEIVTPISGVDVAKVGEDVSVKPMNVFADAELARKSPDIKPASKPTGKLKEFPDGTVYEMRHDGWRRRDDLRKRS